MPASPLTLALLIISLALLGVGIYSFRFRKFPAALAVCISILLALAGMSIANWGMLPIAFCSFLLGVAVIWTLNLAQKDPSRKIGHHLAIKDENNQQERTDQDLKISSKELEIIIATSRAASQLDLDTLVAQTGRNLEENFKVNSVFIAILDPLTNLIETPFWTINHQQIKANPMEYGKGLTSTVLKSGSHLLIDENYAARAPQLGFDQAFARKEGTPKTWLGVPIIANGEPVGVISLQDYGHEHAFSTDDIRLLETIGANLGIAIQNARLYKNLQKELGERAEAETKARWRLEEMTAINSIGRAITAGLELDQVLSTLREQCQQISTAVDIFTVAMVDERTYKFTFLTFFDNGTSRNSKPRDVRGKEAGLTGKIIQEHKTIYIPDALSEDAQKNYNILHTADRPARSYLGIPLLVEEKTIGVLSVQSYQPNAFRPEEIQILETVALQAAIALKNAKLYEETRRRMGELAMLYDVSMALSSDLDLEQVMQNLFQICHKVLPMDAFYIGLFAVQTNLLSFPLFWEKGEILQVEDRDITIAPGISGEVLLNRKTIHLPDMSTDDPNNNYQVLNSGGADTRCFVGVPMLAHNQAVGLLSMQTLEPDLYTAEHILLLETIASQAAIAIENSRLYRQSQDELNQRRIAQQSLEEANQNLHLQINRVEALQIELREQAIRDELTGLHNRRYMNESLQPRLDEAKEQNQAISVIMIDIDRFKTFNDTYGHHAGDLMLQKLSSILRQNTRSIDITCRYGGEEFIIALPDTPLEIAFERAEAIRTKFAQASIIINKIDLHCTISIGIAGFPHHGTSVEELVIQADQAMYAAKSAGRNKVIVWNK